MKKRTLFDADPFPAVCILRLRGGKWDAKQWYRLTPKRLLWIAAVYQPKG